MVHAIKAIIVTIAVFSQRQAVAHGGRLYGNASFVSHTPWEKHRCRCNANNARRLLTLTKRTEACEEGGPNILAKSRRSWEESYALLCAFKEKYGHHDISQSEKPLGPWINRQRIEHAKYLMREEIIRSEICNNNLKKIDQRTLPRTSMTAHRKKLLDEFGFVWDAMGQTWDTRYEEL